jgi:hypothetical protein
VLIDNKDVSSFRDKILGLGGFASNEGYEKGVPHAIYVATQNKSEVTAEILLEEAGHISMLNLYKNDFEPYTNDEDPRKEMLEKAIAQDQNNNRKLDNRLELKIYDQDKRLLEIPVKVLVKMAMGTRGKADAIKCPNITQYVEQVLLPDFEYFKTHGYAPKVPAIMQEYGKSHPRVNNSSAERENSR